MPKKPDQFAVEKRWTPELVADGWTPVADSFLRNYAKLNVTSSEAILIVHIVSYKWDSNLPFPSATTLAAHMGVTATAVRNNLRSLEEKKLLRRVTQRGKAKRFDLSLLFNELKAVVEQPRTPQQQIKGGQNADNQ